MVGRSIATGRLGAYSRAPNGDFCGAAVIAEFFVSLPGVGMYVLTNARSFKHNEAEVGVLALVAFGLLFELTMNCVMRRYFPWYRREDRAE